MLQGKTGGSRAVHWMLLKQAFGELQKGVELDLLSPIGRDQLRNATKSGVFVFNTNRATDIMQVIKFAKTHNIEAVIHGGREAWLVADAPSAGQRSGNAQRARKFAGRL